jgi:transcriptional regulator with XRE-family HTH domain
MNIGDRLRRLREEMKLTQSEVQRRTGFLRPFISRIENGHNIPKIETLEKFAHAFECPLYQILYDGDEPPEVPDLIKPKASDRTAWGSCGKDAQFLDKLRRVLKKTKERDRKLLLKLVQKMVARTGPLGPKS